MPASTDLPWGVRQPAERPPGLGDASSSVTLYPASARCLDAPKPALSESLFPSGMQ